MLELWSPYIAQELSFTTWTHYINVSLDITSLNRLSVTGIYYQDGSYFVSSNITYSLDDNCQLLAQVQRFDGSPASQFGQAAASQFFAQLRWSY